MRRILKNRVALSTVVTTLIILVISVLLAGVVSYFAINVTSTRVQEESVHITKHHVWHSGSNRALASLMIINTGGRDLVIDKISVRGQECDWNSSIPGSDKFVNYCRTTSTISADLNYVDSFLRNGTNTNVTIGQDTYNFTVAEDDLILKSGWTMLIYIENPDSISINDI
ncbi:MAG: type IV pilin, partial [Candidatus Bathyarchaeota archaeon]|nr:type IV pilin [Candidatus Bathyarchaeota archaeon]